MDKIPTPKTELVFENLNTVGRTLNYIEGRDPQELLNNIRKITLPLKIVSIYAVGSRHVAWVLTNAKIKRK